ncbi:PREDICTED: pre-mRNA-processing factor 39 isoform X1 [Papilio xuthus]|uniref:Pre-mRNA-processing factor 39 isoform X1 n=1 Tax=Papilio xuthus TaxID=66420 RepID=A0AAJ7EBM3_PAPXU|nr:PREDICTED: pre-mRNA-processing factor 39 isoform X1 [Papilio xuthus]
MDDDASSDAQKCTSESPMDTDEGPLINENSNGLSHLLTEGEFNSVDAGVVDESSTSNQAFLNAVELSAGSVGDYLENNATGFSRDNFDVGDNAVEFSNESSNALTDGDSRLSEPVFKAVISDVEDSQDGKVKGKSDNVHDNAAEITNNIKMPAQPENTEDSKLEEIDCAGNNSKPRKLVREINNVSEDTALGKDKVSETINKGFPEKQNSDLNNDLTDRLMDDKVLNDAKAKTEFNVEGKIGGAEETEVVSEDELPAVQKPSVKDAENVSDDELPGPKPADLPADTEVVSEDELPSSKKESKESRKRKPDEERDGYDPGSPTSEGESSNKKQAVAKNGESKPIPAEKRSSIDEKPKKKPLPELDKYWKVVNDDPTDFTGWTYLLQYVDQESDVEAAREAYDAFLSHYPYCYGYWRKYADYEKRKGSKKKCLEVLERGLKAIPLSVDLWIHYLNHIKATRSEDLPYVRSQYERAIEACGLEFRSDRLWESYIKWEAENGTALNVTGIYDRLLATPTLGYTSHFDNFQEHVMSEPVGGVVPRGELVRLRSEVRETAGAQPQLDLPPGEDEPQDHIASEEEAQAIKERIIAARRKVHKTTGEEVAARWAFEEGIKRPYFHVKPLERCQLKNWKAYLEWEKQHGTFKRALVLHERCLIACALYEEFWMRLVKFLEERAESEAEVAALQREVLERACTVHHPDKPELHLYWAHFEEAQDQPARAAEILDRIEKTCPTLVQIQYRRVNLERRRGDYEKCCQLYESYIAAAKSKAIASALSVKYVRFLFHVRRDASAAKSAIDDAIARDPLNVRLHMQRLDIALHTPGTPYEMLEELAMSYEREEGAEPESAALMACRRRELAEELGSAAAARAAHRHWRMLSKHLRKRARKDKHEHPPLPTYEHTTPASIDPTKKKDGSTMAVGSATTNSANSGYYQTPTATAQSYDQSYAQPYQPPWGYQQPPGPYQHHPHPWPQYPNYY